LAVAEQIANYGDLKEAVADWLNRADLTTRIPTFIYLAERRIFRVYRMPNNEKTVTYDFRTDPEYDSLGSGNSDNQLELTDRVDIPRDYLETRTLQWDGKPLERVSLTQLQKAQDSAPGRRSAPEIFCRERGKMLWWPFPADDGILRWIYYCDLSGNLIEDTDDNTVLRVAPDLYLYGALLQAQPFLKPEDDEWQLVPTWKQFFNEAMAELEFQRDEDEVSGSVIEVQSPYHGRGNRNLG
jgi:hypothetical protein